MFVETGHFALILALALSLALVIVPFVGARIADRRLMTMGTSLSITMFAAIALAFAALTQAYVTSDFSVLNVVENSHTAKPLIYKISGVWGNHEGSMLLWVFILSLFGALVALFGNNIPPTLKANVLAVQGLISAAFLLFILITSNPFIRLENPPMEGQDLNPILQDIGLAIHPPLLYLGYVGFSIAFAFGMAALIDGRVDAAWARWVRPWTLAAWMFLTAGIAMGSYWAYYELGWGGFWFWDPVENASLIPWLSGTALLHSAVVMEKRGALKIWTILLSIITFGFSLLGTFLVRSGVLSSVHSFATDPSRGLFILGILVFFVGGAFTLFALRASSIEQGGLFHPISREGALVFNNLFLTVAAATVLTGTLYPLLMEAMFGEKITVGAPFFNLTFGPLMVPLFLAIPFGPLLGWKRGDMLGVSQRLFMAFGLGLIAALAVLFWSTGAPVLAAAGIALAVYVIVGSLVDIVEKSGSGRVALPAQMARLAGLPRSVYGTFLGHLGMGITLLGLVAVSAFGTENVVSMKAGDKLDVAGFHLEFTGMSDFKGPNFTEQQADFAISFPDGTKLADIHPAKRVYPSRGMPTTESGIMTRHGSQLYIALGDKSADESIVVRIWWKPLVTLIWYGALLMVVGATLSLSDRRLRIGAPKAARKAMLRGAEA